MNPPRRPTLADVAARAGTSTAVVSYVVNDGPRAVAPATRERVERAIAELGYRRNALAGALSSGRTDLVGLLVPDSSNAFFGELARHVEGEARRRALLTLLGNTAYDTSTERDYLAAFSDLRPSGILVTSIAPAPGPAPDCPLVYLHSAPRGAEDSAVLLDDEEGAASATRHLLAHGFAEVHCVTGPDDFGPAGRRVAGWRRALREAGRSGEGLLHRVSFVRFEAAAALHAILAGPERPRALFVTTDEQALAAVRVAGELGLRLPTDLAVVGFDGIQEALNGSVRLTTAAAPLATLVSAAFDALAAARAGSAPARRVLRTTLVLGETCGPH
ncbi:LacI family DNA-binding transcriptional regulator [Microbacterium sp.]|uniref:LacI family DNA-binding transcriptional regulator n=1 Tax=Microbacterium sp. TaxID=51671 RepID=UPI003221EB0E